jgi:NADP-dependent 3-hydroxy acid dehydrogenase YdfG
MSVTDLNGRVGIITGGTRGIGAAIAHETARLGARVVLCARSSDGGDEIVEVIHGRGGEALFVAADVCRFEQMEALRDAALERFGRLDFVVANAGLTDQGTVADGDPEIWRRVLETNVLGAAYVIKATLAVLQAQGSGDIVLMSSVAGREIHPGEPIYAASKWAVVALGRALRSEVREYGVRVTLIEPGLVETSMARSNPTIEAWLDAVDPLHPDDVARAVVYALTQPPHVVVGEILLRPLREP